MNNNTHSEICKETETEILTAVRERYLANKDAIDKSYNSRLQEVLYKKILKKFNHLQQPSIFNDILSEWTQFCDNFLVNIPDLPGVPPDDIHSSGLWKFWPLSTKLNKFRINGIDHSTIDFFKKTYNHINSISPERLIMIGFSVLKPNCKLKAHTGYHNNMPHNCVFRLHLPIVVPSSNYEECGMCIYEDPDEPGYGKPVTDITRRISWTSGELIIFDDSFKHIAWNNTDEPRVNILIDYVDDNYMSNSMTARSPLTDEMESIKTCATGFFEHLFEQLNSLRYIEETVNQKS